MHSSFGTELARIGQVQQHLPAPAAVLLGLLALAASAVPVLWQLTVHVNTIAHEGAHATMASAVGQKVVSVTLNKDGTGLTTARGGGPAEAIVVGLAGYLGPSAFGLAAAKLIQIGHSIAVLWLAILLLVCILVVTRSIFGVLTVVASVAGLYLIAANAPVGAQVATAYTVAWFLLVSGLRVIAEHGAKAGDAGNLRALTRVPRGFWSVIWLTGSTGALGLGAALLV
jgi:Peptidase M50B-like